MVECGKMLEKNGYVIKSLNTINFRKSMHYNPFAYIRSEKDILKLVNTIIVNTKGDGDKSGEDFWVKAEKLYYTALIGYIWYEAPEHEKNFTTLLELINASEAREDDEAFKNPVDLMFDELEERDPDHFAVKQYRKYKLAAGDTRKNIPFHISTDSFGQKLGTCSEKISLSLYNGHFIRRLAGKAGIKFPSRKVPTNLQRTLFRLNAGMAAKYF